MKVTAALFVCVILLALFLFFENNRSDARSPVVKINKLLHEEDNSIADALRFKTISAKQFVKNNGYNQQVCFLIDMKIRSGSNRFFVYDLKNDSVVQSGVVTHGRCNERWLSGRKYGNEPGCGCTSLGRYKIGNSYMGRFGLAYKLHGLDSTNNNAFKRFVVLHAHDCVPENEVWSDICQSDGCPTVSPGFLQQLKAIINESRKPILLWIYESK
ncbi:murein L,D-transpeptidase catalytic domain-containing protein [Lacibacter sp.]|uniref:murein L,D-transpeptidase catalytic domain-containing protein n=1 Tax=Lacibacter sp. TaxID=1915409 RepID=UPI002B4AC132|nr:murein L,D-transpeptidase catalytic domain family protein [Lacibacter sp.]HLP38918.1 murein L,D-transpeptidase catalytic domain family protein [Lacibacter sp.]